MAAQKKSESIKINLVLTNDWEVYGEGSGDFYTIQKDRLQNILHVVERHEAKISIFAELGQQWAHLEEGTRSSWAKNIAKEWEASVKDAVSRGHDVQMHYHPTWRNARHDGTRWNLDLRQWALADLSALQITDTLVTAKNYLNSLCRCIRADYDCVALRAGAFCVQPTDKTFPAMRAAGIFCDSSVVPGHWDYLYFDYRKVSHKSGPYFTAGDTLKKSKNPVLGSMLELPVHTELVWDFPLLRRILPDWVSIAFQFGIFRDRRYRVWAKGRDQKLRELSPVLDPLVKRRFLSRLSPKHWAQYFFRRSTFVLDYDFLQPQVFVEIIKREIERSKKSGVSELTLIALGHSNNAHTGENLDRILQLLRSSLGNNLHYLTIQEVVKKTKAKN